MAVDSKLARMLQAEQSAEAERALAHRHEADRHAGVAWSGLAPDPFRPRPAAALAQVAETRLRALERWRASPPGRLLAAMADAERAVEVVRACVARGLDGAPGRCASALADLQSAVDAARAAALTAGACATNSASRPPSTG
jgi:hypothetical protein